MKTSAWCGALQSSAERRCTNLIVEVPDDTHRIADGEAAEVIDERLGRVPPARHTGIAD